MGAVLAPVHLARSVIALDGVWQEVCQVRLDDRPNDVGIPTAGLDDEWSHYDADTHAALSQPLWDLDSESFIKPGCVTPTAQCPSSHQRVHRMLVHLKAFPKHCV